MEIIQMREIAVARIGFRGLYVAPFSKAWKRQVHPCNRQN